MSRLLALEARVLGLRAVTSEMTGISAAIIVNNTLLSRFRSSGVSEESNSRDSFRDGRVYRREKRRKHAKKSEELSRKHEEQAARENRTRDSANRNYAYL
jgi:hypothetical protein